MTFFYAKELINNGYFHNLNSPYDGKNLGDCIKVYAFLNNGNIDINLKDFCY